MKYCPACNEQFDGDLNFCLHDGTPLLAKTSQFTPSQGETQSLNFCGYCAAALAPEYAFCKKCGTPRSKSRPLKKVDASAATVTGERDLTAVSSGTWFEQNKALVISALGVVVLLVLIGGIYYAFSGADNGNKNKPSNSSYSNFNRPPQQNRVSAPVNSNAPTPNQNYSRTDAGKTGRLATDLNIRDAPNKYGVSLGIHYRGAKIRVLESTSYQTPEGEMSTWYRVEIYEYGCSVDANLGCGKNSDADSDSGWLNSKYVLLD